MLHIAGAISISEGSVFSDVSRSVYLMAPNCLGNESSLTECSQHFSLPCTGQGGVAVVCQGTF